MQEQLISQILKKLVTEGVKVHMYNSYSTSSVYLKFDYGAAYTLRVADHPGKPTYNYRYTLRIDKLGRGEYTGGHPMFWYGTDNVELLLRDILSTRTRMRNTKTQIYNNNVIKNKAKLGVEKGFWSGCIEVNIDNIP